MAGPICIEFLEIGMFEQHSKQLDVSLLITYYKIPEVEFDINNIFIVNSIGSDIRTVYDDSNRISIIYVTTLTAINNIKHSPFNTRLVILEVDSVYNVEVDESRIKKLKHSERKTYNRENRHVFLWKYGKNVYSIESVFKYMLIPYLLTILLQLTHTIKGAGIDTMGNWISVSSTFMLTDVALFFTTPQTNELTGIERSLFLSFFMKGFICLFAFYDFDHIIGKIFLGHHNLDIVISILISIIFFGYSYYLFKRSSSMETINLLVQHMEHNQ